MSTNMGHSSVENRMFALNKHKYLWVSISKSDHQIIGGNMAGRTGSP